MEEWKDGMGNGSWGRPPHPRGERVVACLPWGDIFTPRTGCYSATLPGPLVRNGDSRCYIGCYKVLHRVLHFQNRLQNPDCSHRSIARVERARTLMFGVES
jgi:hypothetical protein